MNHSYIASADGTDRCSKCKFPSAAHSNEATCECCPNKGPVEIRYGNMLMCDACWNKEQSLKAANNTPEKQQERVTRSNILTSAAIEASRAIDNAVQVRSDLFNAATVSINELKQLIDANTEITNKPYAIAEELLTRLRHHQKVMFEAQETVVNSSNNIKAIQIYLNTVNLREEERKKLQLQDINYQPKKLSLGKAVKDIKLKGPRTRGIDQKELKKYAEELGLSPFTIQMIVAQKGCTVEEAANLLRRTIKEAKSEESK